MKAKDTNLTKISNFRSTLRRHCEIIETCLLDYEKYGIKDLLSNASNSVNQIRLAASSAEIRNALNLAGAILRVISFAIEGKIKLFANDIDVLLRSNDLFFSALQFSDDEIFDLFESEHLIINGFISDTNKLIAPYRILNKAQAEESLTQASEDQNKTILLEKFKHDLVRSTLTIENSLANIQDDSTSIDAIPVSHALNTIKGAAISAGINKAFDLAHSMQEFVAFAAEHNVPISTYHFDLLAKCNRLLKEIASGSAIALIDKFKDYSDYIDNYSTFLNNFLSDQDVEQKSESAKLISKDIHFSGLDFENSLNREDKSIFFDYKSAINDQKSKNERLLENAIDIISNISNLKIGIASLRELKSLIREVQLQSNEIIYNVANSQKITQTVLDVTNTLDAVISKLDEAQSYSDSLLEKTKKGIEVVYTGLYNLRSVLLGDIAIGFGELTNNIALYSGKQVKLRIIGRFVRIDSELSQMLEIILPQILRMIIIKNIEPPELRIAEGKPPQGEITLSASLVSGRLLIEIEDDGQARDAQEQFNDLSAIAKLIQNNKGKIDINARHSIGTSCLLSFNLDFILLKCLVFEVAGSLYALQIVDTEAIIDFRPKSKHKLEHFHVLDIRKILNIQAEFAAPSKPAVIIKQFGKDYAVVFDKFIGEADLSPSQPNKYLTKIPFISATAIYNDMPVVILDKDKLLSSNDK